MYLVPFALFLFLLFFCREKGYFNSLVGRVKDSSSAGQSMTYVSVLGTLVLWEGVSLRILGASKKSFIIAYILNFFY